MAEHQKAQELDPIKDHIGGELYFRRKWEAGRDLTVDQGGETGNQTQEIGTGQWNIESAWECPRRRLPSGSM